LHVYRRLVHLDRDCRANHRVALAVRHLAKYGDGVPGRILRFIRGHGNRESSLSVSQRTDKDGEDKNCDGY